MGKTNNSREQKRNNKKTTFHANLVDENPECSAKKQRSYSGVAGSCVG
jgi:hypothetical protein